MRSLGCLRSATLLERRAAGLTGGERLLLEAHLAACAACAAEVRALAGLAAIVRDACPEGTAAADQRAVARALDATRRRENAAAPAGAKGGLGSRRVVAAAVAVAAIASLSAAAFFLVPSGEGNGGRPGGAHDALVSGALTDGPDAVLREGDLRAAATALSPGADVPPGVALATRSGAVLDVGRAHVRLEAGTVLSWKLASVRLELGRVYVRVDRPASAVRPAFRIVTPEFTVEVVGTELEVDLEGVRVARGHVRVRTPSGLVLVEELGAGGAWRIEPPAAAGLGSAAAVARARGRLAAGDAEAARAELERALAGSPGAEIEAEARTLLAECALVGGDRAGAVRLYLEVADRFAALPAGEVALFAAARLEAERGDAAEGRRLLRSYLDRHPTGRFRAEAVARLAATDR